MARSSDRARTVGRARSWMWTAAERGVDVQILLPAKSNHVVADWISRQVLGTAAHGDKVSHFAAYAALSLVTVVAFGRHRQSAAGVLFLLLGFGGALELLQAAGGVRTGDWLDLLANTLGIMAGGGTGAIARLVVRRLELSPA